MPDDSFARCSKIKAELDKLYAAYAKYRNVKINTRVNGNVAPVNSNNTRVNSSVVVTGVTPDNDQYEKYYVDSLLMTHSELLDCIVVNTNLFTSSER